MPQIKASDVIWIAAESAINLAKKSGIEMNITDIYRNDTANALAMAARFMIAAIETTSKMNIDIVNDIVGKP